MNDTIGIDHGDNFEDKVLSEFFSLFVGGKKKLEDSIAYVRADTFARMDSGSDDDVSFLDFLKRVFFSNGQ